MRVSESEILRLAKGLLAAPESALDCAQAVEWLPAAVDAAVAGEDVARAFPDLAAHLELCGTCRQEFGDLLEIARAAESGSLPQPAGDRAFRLERLRQRAAEMPQEGWRKDFLRRLRRYMDQTRAEFAGAGAQVKSALGRAGQAVSALLVGPQLPPFQPLPVRDGELSGVWQREYHLEPLELRLTLKAREFDRRHFTLRGLVEGKSSFAGMGVGLLDGESGELLDSTRVDSANTFSFHDLAPGRYEIRLDVTETEAIVLTEVDI